MREWIYGSDFGTPMHNEEIYVERYRRHADEVRAYFQNRPQDLLEISWEKGEGWEKLCPFLGVPIPDTPFPHAGKGDYSKKKSRLFPFLK